MDDTQAALPCPFCGHVGLSFGEGSTFRWLAYSCHGCGMGNETRVQTLGEGTQQQWRATAERNAVKEWNTRAAAHAGMPIDMVLHCPVCRLQHIDRPEGNFLPGHTAEENDVALAAMGYWTNPPHRSHLCHGCGHIWRPADVPTNGVAAAKTKGKNDLPAPAGTPEPSSDACQLDALRTAMADLRKEGIPSEYGYTAGAFAELKADADRFLWLTEDHDDAETRAKCRELLGRMAVIGRGAARADIDSAMVKKDP